MKCLILSNEASTPQATRGSELYRETNVIPTGFGLLELDISCHMLDVNLGLSASTSHYTTAGNHSIGLYYRNNCV